MKHKEEILRLRSEGLTYNQIIEELGCSKGTVSFHCGEGQKSKSRVRNNRRKETDPLYFKLGKKVWFFQQKMANEKTNTLSSSTASLKRVIHWKCGNFKNVDKKMRFKTQDLLDKIEGTGRTCALTGRPLNLEDSRSWHLDHIVPTSKGGDNSLENCQVVCADANQAKSGMLQEDFLQLCKEILEYNGYKVEPSTSEVETRCSCPLNY